MYRSIFALCILIMFCARGMSTHGIITSQLKVEKASVYLAQAGKGLELLKPHQVAMLKKLNELSEYAQKDLSELKSDAVKFNQIPSIDRAMSILIIDEQGKRGWNEGKIASYVRLSSIHKTIKTLRMYTQDRITLNCKIDLIVKQLDQSDFESDGLKKHGELHKNLIEIDDILQLLIAETKLNMLPPVANYFDSVSDFMLSIDMALKYDEKLHIDNYSKQIEYKTSEYLVGLKNIQDRLRGKLSDITYKEIKLKKEEITTKKGGKKK